MTTLPGCTVVALNAMPRDELAMHLRACCGSGRWVERMIARRPWTSLDDLLASSDDVCRVLRPEDWMEAFSHHPRLGETQAAVPQGERARGWSAGEQAALTGAAAELRQALAAANAAYEQQFGYICIVCAAGKDSEELLAVTRARLGNSPQIELRIAAEEQRKIARLRLHKLCRDAEAGGAT
jgi:OHCU decarboxylase